MQSASSGVRLPRQWWRVESVFWQQWQRYPSLLQDSAHRRRPANKAQHGNDSDDQIRPPKVKEPAAADMAATPPSPVPAPAFEFVAKSCCTVYTSMSAQSSCSRHSTSGSTRRPDRKRESAADAAGEADAEAAAETLAPPAAAAVPAAGAAASAISDELALTTAGPLGCRSTYSRTVSTCVKGPVLPGIAPS